MVPKRALPKGSWDYINFFEFQFLLDSDHDCGKICGLIAPRAFGASFRRCGSVIARFAAIGLLVFPQDCDLFVRRK